MARKLVTRKESLSPQLKHNKHTIFSTEQALAKLNKVMPNVDQVSTGKSGGSTLESADKS